MNKILKKIWMTLAILIILMAVFSSIFRSLTPWAKQYKSEVEHHLSLLLEQPVTIQTMETGWYWFQPILKLNQVTLGEDPQKAFHLSKLLVGINLFKSLWNWQLQPGVLYIDDMHLNFREKKGHWTVDGISADALDSTDMTPEKSKQLLTWLSQQERLIIKRISAFFYFNDGGLIPVSGLNISILNNRGHYKIKGSARLEQTNSTDFELLGDGYFDPEHFENIDGTFYFAAQNVIPAQWQSLFPKTTEHLEGGKGSLHAWMDVQKGNVVSVHAQIQLENLAWRLINSQHSQLIQYFAANLYWKPDDTGWEMHGDGIKLRIGGMSWPENQILLKHNKEQQTYQFFVKNIIIESLLSEAIDWPKGIKNLLKLKPQGLLQDSQVIVKVNGGGFVIPPAPLLPSEGKVAMRSMDSEQITWMQKNEITYVLTRFENIGWNANSKLHVPEIKNLTGVVYWQPDEGRLELNAQHTRIAVKNYPEQEFDLINGSCDWKELNDGLRISMDHFVVSKPDLTVSVQGVVDQVTKDSIGFIRLGADFSGKNIEQWAAFLPREKLKPKLYDWLTQDLKHIGDMSGKITLQGMANDFPFDNNNGEFLINAHASNADLFINSKWKIIKDMEADLRLKNRNFTVDITHADIQGVPVQQMNLRIDDIGKDKETMIIKGSVQGSLQKMMDYTIASPLKTRLELLHQLKAKGSALLHLWLEVPLYPENDTILAKGDVAFKNNDLNIRYDLVHFNLNKVNGKLLFDQEGVNDSSLVALALGHPLNIKIQSVNTPKAATTIAVDADWSAESLKSQFNLPLLSVLHGSFPVHAVLNLAKKSSDADTIVFNSPLTGLAVNLPAPLGKEQQEKIDFSGSLDLNTDNSIRLKSNYGGHLSTDILFKTTKGVLNIDSGQIKLGSAEAKNQKYSGLAVVGSLKGFDLEDWKNVYNQFSTNDMNSSFMSQLRMVHVTFDKLRFMKQNFDAISVQARRLSNKDWSFILRQKNISGDLTYHAATNQIKGHLQQLHLDKLEPSNSGDEETAAQKRPDQIPNLDLNIDRFSVGSIQLGSVALGSKSTPERWSLNYCRIESPVYKFTIQGNWTQKNAVNKSQFDVTLEVSNLAKTLELWDIIPVVDAKKGYIQFRGGWNNTLYDFSRAALNGALYVQLKNGRITHLSQETEEKLGLGKLLSILSLQTIPRRLQLDFSDLAHMGYSFDIFQGNFQISKGIMTTEDSYLNGPVAYASMKGELDLVKRIYNLNLKISPHITASLPIVATIAGGPVAGVATWVATKIINQGMQKISAYSYKISGPWNQPVVQQLGITRKKASGGTFPNGRGVMKHQLNLD